MSRSRLWSLDHKTIGVQFLISSLVMLLLGGLLAMAVRWQLAWPWTEMPIVGRALFGDHGRVMSPEGYTALFTMHGTVMIFFVIIPLLTGAFGNYLIPLMIGARDMAFPRLNAFSFWIMVPGIACALAGFALEGGAAAAGWTAYPPLSTVLGAAPGSGAGQTLWLWALFFSGLSSLSGAINYVVTIVTMRAPGMSLMRMPLTVWGLFVAAMLQCMALPVLTAATVLQYSDRALGTGFYSDAGTPLLWQHLFWFYSHPAVYVMVVPAMGMVSDILSVHSRKPVFGYKPMVWAMVAITGLGVLVWGHHMFVSGMSPIAGTGFMLSTILIALPSAVKTFNWLGTVWGRSFALECSAALRAGLCVDVCHRRAVGHLDGRDTCRCLHARYVCGGRALPLHRVWWNLVRCVRRAAPLVPQDHRQALGRAPGQDPLCGHLRPDERCLLADAPSRLCGHGAQDRRPVRVQGLRAAARAECLHHDRRAVPLRVANLLCHQPDQEPLGRSAGRLQSVGGS